MDGQSEFGFSPSFERTTREEYYRNLLDSTNRTYVHTSGYVRIHTGRINRIEEEDRNARRNGMSRKYRGVPKIRGMKAQTNGAKIIARRGWALWQS